jgi:hypothetical protein
MGDLTWLLVPLGWVLWGIVVGAIILFLWLALVPYPGETEEKPVPKTPWEDRVRMLLNKPEIVWYYKAPDGKLYGGQPRLDFVACDIFGRFIMIEVKSLPSSYKSFMPANLVPSVQQDALDRIAGTASGVAILAVGHDDILRLYSWGRIRGLPRVSLTGAGEEMPFWMGVWKGPAKWTQHNLHVILAKNWHPEPGPYSGLGPLAGVTIASIQNPPYSALPDPLLEITSPLILPPGMEPRRIATTQSGFEAMMKYAQASGSPMLKEMKKEIYDGLESTAPTKLGPLGPKPTPSQGATRPVLEPIQNPTVKRAKPVPPAPPPEKTSGEKRKEILKKANRQHHAR